MAKKTGKFPFRFYNHEPEEWGEGGQLWLVRFVDPVSPAQRALLGQATGEAAFGGGLDVEDFWFSDGPWAAVTTEDHDDGAVFVQAGPFFETVHGLAPIAEVILASAKGVGCSAWDRWSAKAEPLPSVFYGVIGPTGDLFVRLDAYYIGEALGEADYNARCEAAEPVEVAADDGFVAARDGRFRELFAASRDEALAKAARSTKPALVPVLGDFGDPEVLRAETGREVSVEGNWPQHLVIRDPGAEPRTLQPERDLGGRPALSPDGKSVLYRIKQDLIELQLDDGSHQVVFTHELPPITAFSAGYCGSSNRVMASYGDFTMILERAESSEAFTVVDSVDVAGVNLTVLQGRFGFLKDSKKVRVVGTHETKLAHLGNLSLKLGVRLFEAELDGAKRILAWMGGLTYEVANLDKAWDKAFKPKKKAAKKKASSKKTARKAKSKKPKNVKLKLVAPAGAPDQVGTPLWKDHFEWARYFGETGSGRMVLRTKTGVAVIAEGTIVGEMDLTEGALHLILVAHVHPTAERLLLVHGGQLSELCLDTGKLRVVLDDAAVEERFDGRLGGAMYAADGWLVVMSRTKVGLHRLEEAGLSDPVSVMDTDRSYLAPIRRGQAAILTSEPAENQVIEVICDDSGTPTELRHVATLKMPGKKYSRHGANVVEDGDELYLFTDFGCFQVPAWS